MTVTTPEPTPQPATSPTGVASSDNYVHTFRSGQSLTLPKFGKIMTFGRSRRLRRVPEDEQMYVLVEELCDDAALAVLDEMDADETQAFFDAWQKDSGISLGESKA